MRRRFNHRRHTRRAMRNNIDYSGFLKVIIIVGLIILVANNWEKITSVINPSSNINITTLELKIHDKVNLERQKYGLSSLSWDDKISERARQHSEDMAINDFFEHDNLIGREMGENIHLTPLGDVMGCGFVYGEEEIADCTISGWMSSTGHRENILRREFHCEGIGVAISEDNKVYVTQKFC